MYSRNLGLKDCKSKKLEKFHQVTIDFTIRLDSNTTTAIT